jgi:CheY-like chemotaxis protein
LPQPPSLFRETDESIGPELRILVVDDYVDAAQSLAFLLQSLRHQVHIAYDGPSALKAALNFRPNVVLLDIGLPKKNGYEVSKEIRQHPTLKEIVLVAMTGYGQNSDREDSLQAGFDHHLVKPADLGELKQILATVGLEILAHSKK